MSSAALSWLEPKDAIMNPATAPIHPTRAARSSRWALAALSLSMLLSSLGTSSANVALPTLAQAFGAAQQQVQWVVIAYLLAVTALVVSAGRLGDLIGRRTLLVGGIALFSIASLLCAGAPTLGLLIAARAAQGLGAAVMMALSMAFIAAVIPKEKVGSAMGLLGTMSAVGTALGPTLGGVLIATAGWQAIFLVNVPLGMLALLLTRRCLPCDSPLVARARFDHGGTVLLVLTLGAYALSVTTGRGQFGKLNVLLLFAAGIGAALFLMVQARTASPLIRLAMFRNRILSAGFATSALVTAVVMATLVVGPFFLSGTLMLTPVQAGLAMSCGPLTAALAGVPAGRLVDRIGAWPMGMAGLAVMAVGSAMLPWAASGFGAGGYIGALGAVTAGYALFQAANNTAVMTTVAPDQRGVTSGLLALSRNLGLLTGASAMGAIFAVGGIGLVFGAATLLIAVALAVCALNNPAK
jgi:EmrB/QacA subfamily drug resistance transporter